MDFITITAVDLHSSETMSKTFDSENDDDLRKSIKTWENSLPYVRFYLSTPECIEDYPDEIQDVLNDMEVCN